MNKESKKTAIRLVAWIVMFGLLLFAFLYSVKTIGDDFRKRGLKGAVEDIWYGEGEAGQGGEGK